MYKKQILKLSSSKPVEIYLPDAVSMNVPIVYALDGSKMVPRLAAFFEQCPERNHPVLISLPGEERLKDYTPWPSPALSERFADFGGEGNQFIRWIEAEVKPAAEQMAAATFPDTPCTFESVLLGYSLGGLLAVYASFLTDTFSKIISISGSFWYPEWDTFIKSHTPVSQKTKYLMLYGNKEGNGKQTIQKCAPERSELTYHLLCQYTSEFPLWVDGGGHHDHMDERLVKAAQWILA